MNRWSDHPISRFPQVPYEAPLPHLLIMFLTAIAQPALPQEATAPLGKDQVWIWLSSG